jgi:hypothetical protein
MLEKMGALKSSKAASFYETLIRRESEAMITESVSGRPRLDMSAVREHNRLNRKHLLHSLLPQAPTRCEFVPEKRDDSDLSRHEIPSSLSGRSLTRLPRSGFPMPASANAIVADISHQESDRDIHTAILN